MRNMLSWGATLTAVLVGLAAAGPAAAQQDDAQLWTTITTEFSLSERVKLGVHSVVRLSDAADGVSEVQLGTDVELDAGGHSLGAGYSYVTRYAAGALSTREHRLRQQVGTDITSLAGGQIAGRLRLEQRWRDDGDDMMLRLRPRLTWTRPIGRGGLAVRLLHESFLHLNRTDWGGGARYDRMRNQIALRRRFGALTGEVGYLNQYSFAGAGQMIHAATLGITVGF
ncbi:MAG TPA: DUF2490 domain-containing protein [Allosphingosinicella sp.]|jgi:hypothetical protein